MPETCIVAGARAGSRATNAQLCASSFRCGPGQSENTWLYAICRFSVNENIKMLTLLIRRLKLSWLVILLVERKSDDINESMYLVDQEGRIDEQIKPWRWRRPKHMGWLHPKVNLHTIPACSEGDESGSNLPSPERRKQASKKSCLCNCFLSSDLLLDR